MKTGGFSLIYWVLILGVFYFFLIAPEKKRQKQAQSMLGSLKLGDNVMTRGGILGTIVSMDGDQMILQTGPDNIKISIARYAVASILEPKAEEVKMDTESSETIEAVEVKENDEAQGREIKEEE